MMSAVYILKKGNFVLLKRIVSLLILSLCFPGFIFAEEKVSAGDRIIGATFKAAGKAFITTADVNKLKINNIGKLNKLSKEKFNKRYTEVYKVIKDLPAPLKLKYGITEVMAKEQVIRIIESLDRKKMLEAIDSVPDIIIAEQFKQYLGKEKQKIRTNSAVEQINKFWSKIIEKANMPSPEYPLYSPPKSGYN